jgi:hypothetical protein
MKAAALLTFLTVAQAHAASVPLLAASPVTVQIVGTDSLCTGGFTVSGTPSAPILTCVTSGSPPVTEPPPGTEPPPSGSLDCRSVLDSGVTGRTQVLEMNWSKPQQVRTSGLGPQDAVVVRFTAGSTPSTELVTISGAEYGSSASGRVAVLSASSCDFSQPPALDWGAVSYGTTVNVYFTVGPNDSGYYPALLPGTTYYLNVKTDPGASCTASGVCDMFFQLRK